MLLYYFSVILLLILCMSEFLVTVEARSVLDLLGLEL